MKRLIVCPCHSQYQCSRRFTPQPFGARFINCKVVCHSASPAEGHASFKTCPRLAGVSVLGVDNKIILSYAYKRTHATRHMRMKTHPHYNRRVPTLVRTHECTQSFALSLGLSHIRALYAQARTYAHIHTIHTHIHARTHTDARARTPIHRYTSTRARARAHTHTHTHRIHITPPVSWSSSCVVCLCVRAYVRACVCVWRLYNVHT